MKKMKTYNFFTIIIVGLLFVFNSCNESEFLDKYPLDQPNPENFFYNSSSAQSAIAASFRPWLVGSSNMYARDMMIIFDAMTDDSYWRPNRSASIQQERWDITPTHAAIRTYWVEVYKSINAANFAIEGIPNSVDPNFTEEDQKAYIAQARFMRAFDYLFLTTFFGDVPLHLKPLSNFEEFNPPRTAKSEIFEQIIADFEYAKQNLPTNWPDAVGAPTKAAGAAFLAKAYLYNKEFSKAEAASREAIQIAESSGYKMLDDYMSVFSGDNERNEELLFYFSFLPDLEGYSSNATVQRICRDLPGEFKTIFGAGGWGYALPQRDLYDAFEEGDYRRECTVFAPGDFFGNYVGAENFTYTHKKIDSNGEWTEYDVTYSANDPVEYDYRWSPTGMNVKKLTKYIGDLANTSRDGLDVPILRMSELYLFLAEALAEQNKNEALVWVNKVRSRASVNMPAKTLADGNLVDIVRHERRVELAMEGIRLFDIMRWGNLGEIFASSTSVKRHFYSDYLTGENEQTRFDAPLIDLPANLLFPIPQDEIDRNENINSNNPGYD